MLQEFQNFVDKFDTSPHPPTLSTNHHFNAHSTQMFKTGTNWIYLSVKKHVFRQKFRLPSLPLPLENLVYHFLLEI